MKKYFILLFSIFICENVFCSSSDKIEVETQSELIKRSDVGIQQNADDIDDEIIDAGLFDWFNKLEQENYDEIVLGKINNFFSNILHYSTHCDNINVLKQLNSIQRESFLKSLPINYRKQVFNSIGRILFLANQGNRERIRYLLSGTFISGCEEDDFDSESYNKSFYQIEIENEKEYKDVIKIINKVDKNNKGLSVLNINSHKCYICRNGIEKYVNDSILKELIVSNNFLEAYREFDIATKLIINDSALREYSDEDTIKALRSFKDWIYDVKITLGTLNLECKPKVLKLLEYACIERTDEDIDDDDIDSVRSKASDDSNISSVKSEVENSDELSNND